jgi:tight adherence protein B
MRSKAPPEPVPPTTTQSSALQRFSNWVGRDSRRRRFDGQIPDTLLLIVAALRAGHSLARAIQMVAEEMPRPISAEFTIALGEISLGLPAAAALARIASRISSSDWDLVVTAVTTQLQTGGNLAEILERISGTIRERVRVQGEIASLTAEARFSALILILLPPMLALLLALRNPHYFQPMTENPLGHVLIAGAVMGQILGAIILRKMLILDV